MTKGVWNDTTPGKRAAAARKGAAARAGREHKTRAANRTGAKAIAARIDRFLATGEPVMTRAEVAAIEGRQQDRVMPVQSIAEILAGVQARTAGKDAA